MNSLRTLIVLFATLNCSLVDAQDDTRGPDSPQGALVVDKPSTLDDAVDRFNALAGSHAIGKQQSALTSEEIIGAIRRWPNNLEIDDSLRKKFDNIAKTGQLPAGSEIQFHTILLDKLCRYTVWWIDLEIDGYRFRVRDRTIDSRWLTIEEHKTIADMNAMKNRLGPNHPIIKEFQRKLKMDRND